ncbi:MAG TPA: hydantoinase/oxoprolinase family protein [Terriglobia bacterium]|nr:hydantoinase/oxoprolinase family protein [Terriglobia bacterium]
MRIGVDTGGTFTDCVVADGRRVKVIKVFSGSPASPEEASHAIVEGVRRLIGQSPQKAIDIIHGTTVSTNSLLERRGARVALVTTHGFEDLIEIGRQARPRLYDLDVRRDPPLVPRSLRWGLKERTAADGSILLKPSEQELGKLRDRIMRSGAESIAVCLLFSFANPSNERRVIRALRRMKIPLSISHQILPEFREYERLSTTAMNAYLTPRIGSYLARLEREAGRKLAFPNASKAGLNAAKAPATPAPAGGRASVRIFVMESSGGITTARQAAREPVRTILSGPAGGVAAAASLAESLGIRQAISFDMGGTSTDVCLFEGRPRMTNETTVGGLPVAVPVIDVHTVGAGGGSLARIDSGGSLRVGPESAGASPGPACYGRGGRRPTVTDAHLILGRIDPDFFLGGTFRLDPQATEEAFRMLIGEAGARASARRGILRSPLEFARGMIAVANANMERALRVISVERGHDPRDFTLIAFGGAGGLQAADLARSLGVARIIIPPNPGTFSALGILLSDAVKDVSQSVLMAVPEGTPRVRSAAFRRFMNDLARRFQLLVRAAQAELRRDHFPSGKIQVEKQLEVRYAGQSYELTVPFSPRFPEIFEELHRKTYGYTHGHKPLEVVNLRLRLTIPTARPQPARRASRAAPRIDNAVVKEKNVWFGKRFHRTPLYDRDRLGIGAQLRGPAILVEYSSTTAVPPGFACRVDENLNLVMTDHAD